MNAKEESKTRYYVQWDTHARHMCTVLCSLMEHQSLVDLAICCGTNTIHAHKCVLASNSPYFREQLEKNTGTEQIVITGLDFAIVKSIIEFMYCGETNILDENLKYMIAAAKFFQMRGLQTLVSDHQEIRFEADLIHIVPPIFLPKKPKYPNAYRPINNAAPPTSFTSFKNPVSNDPYFHRKVKRKFVRSEAEKACAKEAAASRLALEALQKELATTQMSSFVIEESCTETTVENFIPHTDETFINNLNHIGNAPLQVVNYDDLNINNTILTTNDMISLEKQQCNNMLQFAIPTNATKDKLKQILGTDIPGNVEIMFRTSEGSFVSVTEDVLQNISGGTLQYQIVDENGQVGEVRELQVQDHNFEVSSSIDPLMPLPGENTEACFKNRNELNMNISNVQHMPEMMQINQPVNYQSQVVKENFIELEKSVGESNTIENNYNSTRNDAISASNSIALSTSSSATSLEKINSDDSASTGSKVDDTDPFINALHKAKQNFNLDDNTNTIFDNCDVNRYLNLNNLVSDREKDISDDSETQIESPLKQLTKDCGTRSKLLNQCNRNSLLFSNTTKENRQVLSNWCDSKGVKSDLNSIDNEKVSSTNNDTEDAANIDLQNDSNDSDDCNDAYELSSKRTKLESRKSPLSNFAIPSIENEVPWQIFEETDSSALYSPRKTRSSLKSIENTSNKDIDLDYNTSNTENVFSVKLNKHRRLMTTRKKNRT